MKKAAWSLTMILLLSGCASQEEMTLRSHLHDEARSLRLDECEPDDRNVSDVSSLPEQPMLSDYLQYAALNSPTLKTAYYRWAAAVEKAPQARALPNPTVGYTHYIREVETRVGPQKNRFAIMQMVPWPTKLTNKSDRAVREALSHKYLYDAEKLSLFFKVRSAYYEYYYLHQSLQVVKDNLSLLQNIEGTILTRYEAAAATNPSLIQVQVELGKQEDRLRSVEALRAVFASRLNAAIGRSPELDLPWPEVVFDDMPVLDEEALLAALQVDNPGLKAARAKMYAAQAGERLAHAQYMPDFTVGASFIETDRFTDMNPADNGKDPVMVTLEVSLPVWLNKYAAGVREAKAGRLAAENALKAQSNQIAVDLRLAFFNYGDAARKWNLFAKTLVPKAEQALDASLTAFSAGKAGFADVLDTERTLLELRLMEKRAQVDQAIRLGELEMLSGRELRQAAPQDVGYRESPHENTSQMIGMGTGVNQ